MALIQRWPAVSAYLFGRGAEVEVRVVMSISLSGADENRASLEGSRRWMGLYMGLDKSSLLYQPSSSSLLQALLHQHLLSARSHIVDAARHIFPSSFDKFRRPTMMENISIMTIRCVDDK